MRRYALTIALLCLSIGGIGGYYIYAAADRLPEFKLVAVEGEAEAGNAVELSGSYGGRMRSQFVTVSAEGSEYTTRQSFYEKNVSSARSWFTRQPGMQELMREHRGFMRGKYGTGGLYKDEEWLISAEAEQPYSAMIEIDKLDLNRGQRGQVKVALPEQQGLSHLQVIDVQRFGNELHVVTNYLGSQGQGHEQLRPGLAYFLNVIDMENGTLLRQEQIDFGIDGRANGELAVNVIVNSSLGSGEFVGFIVREGQEAPERHLFVYSYATGELKELPGVFDRVSADLVSGIQLEGKQLTFLIRDEERAAVIRFDLASGLVVRSFAETVEELGGDVIWSVALRDDYAYFLLHRNRMPRVVAVRVTDGEIVYRGEVQYAGPAAAAEEEMLQLTLLNLYLRP